ncbi:MAG: hypothetical protein GWP75_13035 [Planctomycetia bacterium]|nr:hypothetical protein [Planctomycetia bacterium]
MHDVLGWRLYQKHFRSASCKVFVFDESRRQKEPLFKAEVAKLRRPAKKVRQPKTKSAQEFPITNGEYKYWAARDLAGLSAEDAAAFEEEGTLHLYARNVDCDSYNLKRLKANPNPNPNPTP